MNLSPLKLGDLLVKIPIIQGGMGVGVSGASLAAAVANEGAVGVISSVQIGYREDDFDINPAEANIRALVNEIKKARSLSPNGILGVNIMVATNNYKEAVLACVKEKIDVIISGAGLPSNLPELVKDSCTKIIPIVSSGKAAATITKMWTKKYDYVPDAVIVEGPEAGGHLGFSAEDLASPELPSLKDIVTDVIESLKPYEETFNRKIPVIAAGGIFTGSDIGEFIMLGASGVQMGTRFVATEECDAHINFKMAYVNAKKEDVQLVKSPVGLPGRAIRNKFVESLENSNIPVRRCWNCLKPCNPASTPYCISLALINSVKGDVDNGLIFSGSNVYRIDKIVTVKELINELVTDANTYLADKTI